jgi:hypothetical protein
MNNKPLSFPGLVLVLLVLFALLAAGCGGGDGNGGGDGPINQGGPSKPGDPNNPGPSNPGKSGKHSLSETCGGGCRHYFTESRGAVKSDAGKEAFDNAAKASWEQTDGDYHIDRFVIQGQGHDVNYAFDRVNGRDRTPCFSDTDRQVAEEAARQVDLQQGYAR